MLTKKEVEEVFEKGKRVTNRTFSYIKIPSDTKTKTSIIIPKKIVKSAVDRNRIKRKLRPILIQSTTDKQKHFGVFLIKRNILAENKFQTAEDIKDIFQKIK